MSDGVVVLGVGLHPFGRFPEKTIEDLGREAAVAALGWPSIVSDSPRTLPASVIVLVCGSTSRVTVRVNPPESLTVSVMR